MAKTHSKMPPSSAKRWLQCPASLRLRENDKGNVFADRGTKLHTQLEASLATLHEEDAELVQRMTDWVRGYQDVTNGVLRTEVHVEIGSAFGLPEGALAGTADIVIESPRELCVADAKFGYVAVPAKDNYQLILYAIGLMQVSKFNFERIRLVILQDRDELVHEHVYTREKLLGIRDELLPKVQSAYLAACTNKSVTCVTGEECRYCASYKCPAAVQALRSVAVLEDTRPSPEVLGNLLKEALIAQSVIKSLFAQARDLLDTGTPIPGWKLVTGRGSNRAWREETEAKNALLALGIDPTCTSVVAPAQAEAKLRKKGVEDAKGQIAKLCAERTFSKSVVPDSDARESALGEFEEYMVK